jgi:hypothetical protein
MNRVSGETTVRITISMEEIWTRGLSITLPECSPLNIHVQQLPLISICRKYSNIIIIISTMELSFPVSLFKTVPSLFVGSL